MTMPRRWQEDAELRTQKKKRLGECLTHKQVHCSGGCGYYATMMEMATGEDGFILKTKDGKWCDKCAGEVETA